MRCVVDIHWEGTVVLPSSKNTNVMKQKHCFLLQAHVLKMYIIDTAHYFRRGDEHSEYGILPKVTRDAYKS